MKTKKQVLAETSYPRLVNAVIARIGMDSVEDVINHGVDYGISGFIYYYDTVKFFNAHKKDILSMAEEMAKDLGEDLLSMIANFNCLSTGRYPDRKPGYSFNEIGEAIYAGHGESVDIIKTAMAWFAAEEVCRMFDN